MKRLALALFIVGLFLILTAPARAHHQTYLPIVPNTPIMKSIKATQEYTWCVNQRASQYPQFAAQVREVSDAYTRLVGIKNRQVEYGAGCQVRHDMRDDHPCGGCAAWVFYANNPVTIEYKATTGYVLWQTTIGHELGHALLGLHEQYTDLGSIQCTGKTWTVMDCGSGVKYPQIRDITLGCSMYQTPWCGTDATAPPPSCYGETDPSWGGTWNNCTGLWEGPDSYPWNYSPSRDEWFDRQGASEWCCQQPYGGIYNRRLGEWFWTTTSTWRWSESDPTWQCAEGCP